MGVSKGPKRGLINFCYLQKRDFFFSYKTETKRHSSLSRDLNYMALKFHRLKLRIKPYNAKPVNPTIK